MLSINDINNNLIFLERVELKGAEAMAMAELMVKLKAMREQQAKSPATPPADPDTGGNKED